MEHMEGGQWGAAGGHPHEDEGFPDYTGSPPHTVLMPRWEEDMVPHHKNCAKSTGGH